MGKLKIKISIKRCIFFLLVFSFFKPGYFDEVYSLDVLFNIFRVISSMIIIGLFCLYYKYNMNTFILLCILEGIQFFSTLINNGSWRVYIVKCIFPLAVFMLCSIYAYYPKSILKVMMLIAEVLTYINLLSIFLFPEGIYQKKYIGNSQCWFLGQKNEFFFFFIFFVIISYLYEYFMEKSIRTYILRIATIFSVLRVRALNALIALILLVVLVHLMKRFRTSIINIYTLMIVDILLWYLILGSQVYIIFSNTIINILHRSLTISGRVQLWSRVLELSKSKFLFGYGLKSTDQTISMYGISYGLNAHDTVLQYLNTGGIFAVTIFLIFCFLLIKKIYMHRNSYAGIIFSAAMFSLFLFSIFETQYNPLIFGIYAFIENIQGLDNSTMKNVT